MKRYFWFLVLLMFTCSLLSQQIEYAYPEELTQPSRTARDEAPEIIASGNVNYIIGSAPVIVAPNITLSNFTEDIEGMKIFFTSNFIRNQDVLELTANFPGIIANYHHSTGVLKLRGSGSSSFWQDVCRHVQYRNSGSTPIQGVRDVTFSIISTPFIPSTGHYYEFIRNHGISWSDSRAIADSSSYYGMQGYLATVTDLEENLFISTELSSVGWIGGSDAEEHNHWKWVCGPEEGTEFWEGLYAGHTTIPGFPVNGMYNNWNFNEPDQYFGNTDPDMWEDYLHMINNPSVGSVGSWNDLSDAGATGNLKPHGFVVEYGGMPGDPELNLYATVAVTVTDIQEIEILPSAGGELEIDETETINFSVNVYDPHVYSWKLDGIEVSTNDSYDFTTNFNSAGTYEVSLHIYGDNRSALSYYWDITVNDVDQNIVVNEILPVPGSITIDELESVAFSIDAYGPDGNDLEYIWKLDEAEVSTTSSYDFTTDYTSAGAYIITLDVTDNFSRSSINYTWDITVNDVDQNIVLNEILPSTGGSIVIDELESIAFSIDAFDPDGNDLDYIWKLDGNEVSTTDSYDFITEYTSAGSYIITLDVTDNFSRGLLNYSWNITVNDVDQNIVVNEILPSAGGSIIINELESVAFSIDAYDPNGNSLQYSWRLDGSEVSTADSYDFITDYSSNGLYIITLDVTDNFSRSSLNYTWDITVNNVDQSIVVNEILPSAGGSVVINELESITFSIDAYDPDGNELEYIWKLDEAEVSTTSTYDFITDYSSAGTYVVSLDVMDNFSRNSMNYNWNITVNDVDQNIVVNEILPSSGGELEINELESIAFSIDAYDPEGNELEYIWKLDEAEISSTSFYDFTTDYSSAGSHIISLAVTDNFSRSLLNYSWNITVNDVDQSIVVNELIPDPGNLFIQGGESIDFSIDAYDPDGNALEYNWKLNGRTVSTTNFYRFTTNIQSSGAFNLELFITDNFLDSYLQFDWEITVLYGGLNIIVTDLNPAPGNLEIFENDEINFLIDAYAINGDDLTYDWQLEGEVVSTTPTYLFETDYTSAGDYVLILRVEDEQFDDTVLNFVWNITVLEYDQLIVINDIIPEVGNLLIQGSESIDFSIDAYDPDGNALEYNWELNGVTVSIIDHYKFTTNSSSSGAYYLELFITDNYSDSYLHFDWNITVLYGGSNIIVTNIDPVPGDIVLFENDEINFLIDAYAYNGDNLTYDWQLNGEIVSITPTYLFDADFISVGNYVLILNVEDEQGNDTTFHFVWNISILIPNLLPVSNAGEDQYVDSGVPIQLDGSGSYDPEGEELIYHWIVPDKIVLSDSNIANPTFTLSDQVGEGGFYIQLIVNDGNWNSEIDKVFITICERTIIENHDIIPQLTDLYCNYPNPFNPTTCIKFDVHENEFAILTIYNQKGQVVERNEFSSGTHNYEWNARNVSSGVYFYRLESKSYTNTRKMILLK